MMTGEEKELMFEMRWVCLEWAEDLRKRPPTADLWRRSAEQRESRGEAMSGMRITATVPMGQSFGVTFAKEASPARPCLAAGEMALVSDTTQEHFGLFLGFVLRAEADSVTLRLDRRPPTRLAGHAFRLDRYASAASHSLNAVNLTRLMEHQEVPARLRCLLVEGRPAEFASTLSASVLKPLRPVLKGLHSGQTRAVLRALRAKDYALIQGYPGSGKTSTVAAVVRSLVALGCRVLLAAYTHSAVDNCLLRLAAQESPAWLAQVLRVGGSPDQLHPAIRGMAPGTRLDGVVGSEARLAELQRLLKSASVVGLSSVGATCLEAGKAESLAALAGPFDAVVIDEASLCLTSAALGPLLRLKPQGRFILVGDPAQLSPLVTSRVAAAEGMAESLMTALASSDGVALAAQFRMSRPLCRLPSELFYNGQLQCANEQVAERRLRRLIPPPPAALASEPWAEKAGSSDLAHAALILDTSALGAEYEATQRGTGLANVGEASLTAALAEFFVAGGVPPEDLGVACFYREQVREVEAALGRRLAGLEAVEVRTVDQYQGRDKEVMLVSFGWSPRAESSTSSGSKPSFSRLISEERRVNVALSRAKAKLCLLGRWEDLRKGHPALAKLEELIGEGCRVRL